MSARAWVARKNGQWSAEAKAEKAARKATARAAKGLICSTCYGAFDSPACSLNRDIGWSGHTIAGNGGAASQTSASGDDLPAERATEVSAQSRSSSAGSSSSPSVAPADRASDAKGQEPT